MKTAELTGAALDWAVANIEENVPVSEFMALEKLPQSDDRWKYRYSTNWSQGGPIIEREKIDVDFCHFTGPWFACIGGKTHDVPERARAYGPTPLIAAMRCFVASVLGDEIEIPEELK